MGVAAQNHADDIEIGSGELFIDLYDDEGNLTGERYVGDAVSASITSESERLQVFSGTGQVARELVNKVRSIARTMTITLHDMSPENLAIFLSTKATNVVQVNEVTGAQAFSSNDGAGLNPLVRIGKINRGRWYQLGRTSDNPRGVSKIAKDGVSVKYGAADADFTSITTVIAADHYRVDPDRGRIYFKTSTPDAAIMAAVVEVQYTAAAPARKRVTTGEVTEIVGAVRYLEDTATGEGRDYYIPRSAIAPSGEMALMSRESEQRIVLTCSIQEPSEDGVASLYIDGEERSTT